MQMRTVPYGVAEAIAFSSSSLTANIVNLSLSFTNLNSRTLIQYPSLNSISPLPRTGVCRASQVAELFPIISPEILVREARLEDSWGVAETHCSSFFPNYPFPYNFMLRMNRLIGILFGFSVPNGYKKTCLVAVTESSEEEDAVSLGREEIKISDLKKSYVIGILSLDTLANFLPRKGPLKQRRSWIAYMSNVAVQEKFRQRGIAKKLVAEAENQARTWGCRAIALHCDYNNLGATKLYSGTGFKIIKVPEGANWPRPRALPGVQYCFMMKLLDTPDG